MPRLRLLAPAVVLLSPAVAAPVLAASTPPARIADGVTAGGIDVSGLTALQAARKLKDEGTPKVQGRVAFDVAGHLYHLETSEAGLVVNGTRTAQAALKAPAGGTVPFTTTFSSSATKAFAERIATGVYAAPKDATLKITLKHMGYTRAQEGHRLDVTAARKLIDGALADPSAKRQLHARVTAVRAQVNTDDLRAANKAIVTVDKSTFTLRLFRNLKYDRSYKVAVGQPAYPTPSGLFSVQDKQVNPTWSVPNSPWAGELQGTTVEGGSAANPLKARWMGIVDGVGIHGTGEDASIGSAASHGCIRMHVADVIKLYDLVPVGSKVLLGAS